MPPRRMLSPRSEERRRGHRRHLRQGNGRRIRPGADRKPAAPKVKKAEPAAKPAAQKAEAKPRAPRKPEGDKPKASGTAASAVKNAGMGLADVARA